MCREVRDVSWKNLIADELRLVALIVIPYPHYCYAVSDSIHEDSRRFTRETIPVTKKDGQGV